MGVVVVAVVVVMGQQGGGGALQAPLVAPHIRGVVVEGLLRAEVVRAR